MIPLAASSQSVLNGSFETLSGSVANSTSGSYTVNFGGLPVNIATGWTLGVSGNNAGYDGIITVNGAPVSDFNPIAVADGQNAVFLQGAGTVSQTLNLNPGQYLLSYYLMGRSGSAGGSGINPVTASLSGGLVNDMETPVNTDVTSASDWTLYSDNFTVTSAGSYTLTFTGDDPYGTDGDHTTFVDNVSIATVPEPSSLALTGLSVLGLFFARRFRRNCSI